MASWRAEPDRVADSWWTLRQVAPDWAPLYHSAGEPSPTQESGRWHRFGEGYAQYTSLSAFGAWAELLRGEAVRGNLRSEQYSRNLWQVYVVERDIADLSTFRKYDDCGLDPEIAVGGHDRSQELAAELIAAGYRGVISPSAALPEGVNLTIFGERYEKVLNGVPLDQWANTNPDLRLPTELLATGSAPEDLLTRTVYIGEPHEGFETWEKRTN